jgi:resuscitation-promoting factor RpfA
MPNVLARLRARLLAGTVLTAVAGLTVGMIAAPADAATNRSWNRLAQCESGGNWHINTGNGYYGGLQFSPSTWRGFGGGHFASSAHRASRRAQIAVAQRVLRGQGWGAWPSCTSQLGLGAREKRQKWEERGWRHERGFHINGGRHRNGGNNRLHALEHASHQDAPAHSATVSAALGLDLAGLTAELESDLGALLA